MNIGKRFQNLLTNIKSDSLREIFLRYLFKKKGMNLEEFMSRGKFFLYKIDGIYIPSEYINWYIDYNFLVNYCNDTSLYGYKPRVNDVVVDVGAGLGEEALIISKIVGKNGKIYSIEANPTVFQIMQEVVKLNQLENVSTFNFAINRENISVNIIDDDTSYKTGFVLNEGNKNYKKVEGKRFESFMSENELMHIDLLKCNIEGAERFLVDSMNQESMHRIRNVAIACHDFRYKENNNNFFVTKKYITQFLESNSFEVFSRKTGVEFKDDWVYARNRRITVL